MTRLAIIGTGGFGREVLAMLNPDRFEAVGFVGPGSPDDDLPLPVLGDDTIIPCLKTDHHIDAVFVAVTAPARRAELFAAAQQEGLITPSLIHPSVVNLSEHPLGEGCIIYPQVTIMNNCRLGRGILINSGSTVGHDCSIGDFCSIGPGVNIAGRCQLDEQVFVGMGSSIREQGRVGQAAVIGAASLVLKEVAAGARVMGCPAQPVD